MQKETTAVFETENKLLTTAEAAEVLSVKPETLEIWRWAKRGPTFYKLGTRSVRYKMADLVDFIESGKTVVA